MGVLKFPQLGLSRLWGLIILRVDLRLRWGLKQSCSPCQKFFQWYVACHLHARKLGQFLTFSGWELNCQFDSQPSFSHNLCFNCPNGSCECILDIYVLRTFEWYKEVFNPLGFDLCNRFLNIQKSIETPISKVEALLGVWGFIPSHFPTLPKHEMWLLGFILGSQPCKPLPWSQAQG